LGGRGGPESLTYEALGQLASRGANALERRGIRPGDRVVLVLATGVDFLGSFFACLRAGAIACPTSPLQGFPGRSAFRTHLSHIVSLVGARALITPPDFTDKAGSDLVSGLTVLTANELLAEEALSSSISTDPHTIALIQFTSGTTGLPRGVRLSHAALISNLRQIAAATDIHRDSVIVSWLPLFHDMGLVGSLLTSVFKSCNLVLLRPTGFLRDPRSWLGAITEFRGTHSPAPTFAYRYVLTQLRGQDLSGIDLSSWRVAWIGAEPVSADLLAAFCSEFSRCGFRCETFLPCYGMAEASLAVTFSPAGEGYRLLTVDQEKLRCEGRAVPPSAGQAAEVLVSCGRPLNGTTMSILSENYHCVAEGTVGEVGVSGPSLFSGYHGESEGEASLLAGKTFLTGDLGFMLDRELYITGRKKELIIVRGRNHHPMEIESVVSRLPSVREGKVAAFGVYQPEQSTQTIGMLVERDRALTHDSEGFITALRRAVYEETGLSIQGVVLVPAGTIPQTTSGKIQRGRAREIFLQHEVTGRGQVR
ncbi:MAG TPA: fatty acyl-AMP ligase, partial [Gemmatimonadales bacterium]|nr:fatty acyl-AMP ligase [Gemmatimonadales bacterium]